MSSCGNCSGEEKRLLLHHVRHRGIFRRLCSSCVLRLNPQSLCPTCFVVYDYGHDQSPSDAVSCFKCYSSSHSHCVPPTASKPYICPLCTNPNSPIFSTPSPIMDTKAARVLVAAARISALSMTKAALAARSEAERRAKEAAFTRKRAREALEHVASLVAKDKFKTLAHHKPIAPLPRAQSLSVLPAVDLKDTHSMHSHSNIAVGGASVDHHNNVHKLNKVTNGLLSVPQIHCIQHNQSTDDNITSSNH